MVVAAVGLLRHDPQPTEQAIARAMVGSVCRCGTNPRNVKAIQLAARRMRASTTAAGGK
jgi:aerobic-type carbon monoxide dehydrogenase small subunit (CoxS/CutS family)